MSILAYVSLGLAGLITLLALMVNPDPKLALTMLPMLLILAGIPWLMDMMNRRQVAKFSFNQVKMSKIKDLTAKNIGEQVRIRGTVQAVANKWLNRPRFQVVDDTGEIGVLMLVAPRENISRGDRIETVGSLRWSFSLSKKKKIIWGLKMKKI